MDCTECRFVLFQFGDAILQIHTVLLQKGMNVEAALKAKHIAQRGFRQGSRTVTLKSERLKRNARGISALGRDLARNIVRDV